MNNRCKIHVVLCLLITASVFFISCGIPTYEDFSDAKLAAAGIRKQFENKDLKSTVAAITTYILEMNR